MRVNTSPVLSTKILSLSIDCGWVHPCKENVEQIVVRTLGWIVVDDNCFRVTGRSTANLVVVWFYGNRRKVPASDKVWSAPKSQHKRPVVVARKFTYLLRIFVYNLLPYIRRQALSGRPAPFPKSSLRQTWPGGDEDLVWMSHESRCPAPTPPILVRDDRVYCN